MPLILLCGYPCSGKSLVTSKLVESLREREPLCEVEVVSEEAIAQGMLPNKTDEDPRATIFANSNLEKQLRSQIRSQVGVKR